jgi:Zn-dependent protease
VILFSLGISIEELKAGLEEFVQEIPLNEDGPPIYSDGMSKALDVSLETAVSLGETKVDSGHFLVGILRTLELKEYSLLRKLGVSYSDVLNKLRNKGTTPEISGQNELQQALEIEHEKMQFSDVIKSISPVFYLLFAAAVALGIGLFTGFFATSFAAFLFVIISWIISVSIHEYGHALVAYLFGDLSIFNKGYLTLNPLKYTNGVTSIIFPIIILAMGGIGLPGGAVYVNYSLIKSKRARSLVAFAGPGMQSLFIVFLLVIYNFLISRGLTETNQLFWSVFSFLLFLQVTSIFLNLLPIPPLDGFGILMPFLPTPILRVMNGLRGFTMMIIFIVFMTNNPVQMFFWRMIGASLYFLGIDLDIAIEGLNVFQFWR